MTTNSRASKIMQSKIEIPCILCGIGHLQMDKKLRYGGIVAPLGIALLLLALIFGCNSLRILSLVATTETEYAAREMVIFYITIPSFFGCLIGLFLCRTKKVIQCNHCGTTQAAE